MKYFYLTSEGVTAGPESLEALCTMMGGGTVSLATLVVPAGGEDWTPLARVLRFFYQDAAGATAGPVAFSELNRLCQIQAVTADGWVVEELGTGWKPAASVLSAGGVTLPAPVVPARVVHATYRPQPSVAANVYATPHAPVGHRAGVRRRATGGIGRAWFICGGLLLLVFCFLLLVAFFFLKSTDRTLNAAQLDRLVRDFLVLYVVTLAILFLGGTFLSAMRIQNIGWSRLLVLLLLVPSLGSVLGGLFHITAAWLYLVLGLLGIFAAIFQVSLLILPPGFARHKRMDAAAWIIFAVIFMLIAGTVAFAVAHKNTDADGKPASPGPEAAFLHRGP